MREDDEEGENKRKKRKKQELVNSYQFQLRETKRNGHSVPTGAKLPPFTRHEDFGFGVCTIEDDDVKTIMYPGADDNVDESVVKQYIFSHGSYGPVSNETTIMTGRSIRAKTPHATATQMEGNAGNPNVIARIETPLVSTEDQKILLIPIACIGCGKSTLGALLHLLFGVGHVQNDDITERGGFEPAVMRLFAEGNRVVFADRNNHLAMHRAKLTEAFRSVYPNGRIVAVDWNVERRDMDEVLDIAAGRVEARGENHQSLTPGRTEGFRGIIRNFIASRHPLDLERPEDSRIERIIDLDIVNTPRQNLEEVCRVLGWEGSTDEEFDTAYKTVAEKKVTVFKHVEGNGGRGRGRGQGWRGRGGPYLPRGSDNGKGWRGRGGQLGETESGQAWRGGGGDRGSRNGQGRDQA
ncbi:tRNA ligase kinase domain-containing protein [Cladochytrium replicatum]|nr:tRNA ligase kinase domain-containing protein [Cladochytrium replicatum]